MRQVSALRIEAVAPQYASTGTAAGAVESGDFGRSDALALGSRFNWGFALALGLCAGFWVLVVAIIGST